MGGYIAIGILLTIIAVGLLMIKAGNQILEERKKEQEERS